MLAASSDVLMTRSQTDREGRRKDSQLSSPLYRVDPAGKVTGFLAFATVQFRTELPYDEVTARCICAFHRPWSCPSRWSGSDAVRMARRSLPPAVGEAGAPR